MRNGCEFPNAQLGCRSDSHEQRFHSGQHQAREEDHMGKSSNIVPLSKLVNHLLHRLLLPRLSMIGGRRCGCSLYESSQSSISMLRVSRARSQRITRRQSSTDDSCRVFSSTSKRPRLGCYNVFKITRSAPKNSQPAPARCFGLQNGRAKITSRVTLPQFSRKTCRVRRACCSATTAKASP